MTLLIIILLILAFGGFGHAGYQRGWYGNTYYDAPRGGWGGGGLGLILLLVVLFLIFGHHHSRYY